MMPNDIARRVRAVGARPRCTFESAVGRGASAMAARHRERWAHRTWCPRGAHERRRRRRRNGCRSSRGLGEVASRRRLARLGALG
eukprot:2769235-Prymnesium_polylepis.1